MKRLFTLIALAMAFVVSSCTYDDTDIWEKLDNHEERITALEELCNQLNSNINALQTVVDAFKGHDYITNVSPINQNGKVIGYTITFANSSPITIYNGTDGEDGYKPIIGVSQGSDGVYYWTIDGNWLRDADGNRIPANTNGVKDGEDGKDGKDGITPKLKIENDYWYVSYDNGETWE